MTLRIRSHEILSASGNAQTESMESNRLNIVQIFQCKHHWIYTVIRNDTMICKISNLLQFLSISLYLIMESQSTAFPNQYWLVFLINSRILIGMIYEFQLEIGINPGSPVAFFLLECIKGQRQVMLKMIKPFAFLKLWSCLPFYVQLHGKQKFLP